MTIRINNIDLSYIQLSGTIPSNFVGKRTDQALAILFPEYSRENFKQWILDGSCLINNQKSKPKCKVQGGELVNIFAKNNTKTADWSPENLPLDIVYEDQDILVLNKPSKLVMHPAAGNWSGTLLNGLLNYYPKLHYLPRAGIIHRLDQNTTGLVVVTKNIASYNNLCLQMQQKEFIKIYEAILWGRLISGGKIDLPIGRHTSNRLKMAVVPHGKPAVTYYRIIKKFNHNTHVKLIIETGRTHQIRVHMQHIKHPIVGDPLYKSRSSFADIKNPIISGFSRQALHATELGFKHPVTKESLHFKVDLPSDMQNLLYEINKNFTT